METTFDSCFYHLQLYLWLSCTYFDRCKVIFANTSCIVARLNKQNTHDLLEVSLVGALFLADKGFEKTIAASRLLFFSKKEPPSAENSLLKTEGTLIFCNAMRVFCLWKNSRPEPELNKWERFFSGNYSQIPIEQAHERRQLRCQESQDLCPTWGWVFINATLTLRICCTLACLCLYTALAFAR